MPAGPIGNQNQSTATTSDLKLFSIHVSNSLEDLSAISTAWA